MFDQAVEAVGSMITSIRPRTVLKNPLRELKMGPNLRFVLWLAVTMRVKDFQLEGPDLGCVVLGVRNMDGVGRSRVDVNKVNRMPKRVTIYRKTKSGMMKKIKTMPCCNDDLCPPRKKIRNNK